MSVRSGVVERARVPARAFVDHFPVVSSALGYVLYRTTHSRLLSKHRDGDPNHLEAIRRDGFTVVHDYWSKDECKRAVDEIERLFRDHRKHVSQAGGDMRVFGAEELSEQIDRYHSDPKLAALASDVCCAKTANAFTLASRVTPDLWTIPRDGGWHRDSRYRQFKSFLYLSDVTADNGPFQAVRGSHRMPQHLIDVRAGGLPFRSNLFRDAQIDRVVQSDPSRLVTFTGGPGTLILADTGMLHRGAPPSAGARYVLTNYFFEKSELTVAGVEKFAPVNPGKMLNLRANW